jgi:hypothetical protein
MVLNEGIFTSKLTRYQNTKHRKSRFSFLLMEGSFAGSVIIITDPGPGGPERYKSYEYGSHGTLRTRILKLGA